ncbi:rRNA primary transcript binding protein [Coprinopsis cinerea okayama7|uniref:rRNA primary transcript binding protein n=1 Tax=Coprinopsis cinerea (strain Okayama-7 / 130 / ATCC MYA-4618 / FGSC 9003) TaxID=240176 RepID=A8NKD9_COPC7|nr:rRNA primary transcript binding protein [Coprinopsis cinerea okayama7\|eukprot:XP_001834421.1 rRNA primary transcript binding protein [Coprinopsis cinerea okayama7\
MSSTRLVIKNLPPYCTPERLRQHFEGKHNPGAPRGQITDVKVSFKPDGTSRRFGFVGYKTPEEAVKAKEWFDRTFIDSARISVALVEDKPDARPNKRRRLASDEPSSGSNTTKLGKPSKSSDPSSSSTAPSTSNSNKHLDTFLEVMQPRNKGPSWANDAAVPEPVVPAAPAEEADASMEDKPEASAEQEGLSDMEWMRRRMTANVDKVNTAVFEQSDDEEDGKKDAGEKEEVVEAAPARPEDPTEETIRQTARLFVRNLTFSCTEEELLELFSPFGNVVKAHIPTDATTKQGKGMAYITFSSPESAVAAYKSLDKKPFQGRLLHILGAVDRKPKAEAEDEGKKSVKEERAAKRKALAGKEFNWSMLYMNSDAVASSIADRMNIPKTSILNPDPSETTTNPAVKLALAETHIITETKTFLESQGVLLSSFTSKVRSDTILLVKNIPYGTTEPQIREMFEPHGELVRVLVPPAGTIAVVEFVKGEEAAKAFKAVAYRRLGNSVVYLEKGPVGMFVSDPEEVEKRRVTTEEDRRLLESSVIKVPEALPIETTDSAGETAGGEGQETVAGSTLYVKNLSFATTQERLVSLFSHLPSFSFARIQTKPDPKRPGARLSMGYGFIGFKDVEGARKALKSLQGFVVDGHELHVKVAGRGRDEVAKELGVATSNDATGKSRTTKMIVKNVPFEATKKDIRDLFGAHGKLKSVRLPRKFDSRTRGFAFLEFVSRHEAENAFNALRHTHLLGRHLVLEWAQEEGAGLGGTEEELEVLRRKVGVGVGMGVDGTIGKGLPGRKRKLEMPGRGDGDPEELE